MTHFVLVAGAWHGSWAWDRVTPHLQSSGEHLVSALSLTGLADRRAQLTPEVGLRTHVDDVVALLESENLRGTTLVGHSYAGVVVRGAADRMPERVDQIVLLDGWDCDDGESIMDRAPDWFAELIARSVTDAGDGWMIPVPPAALMGVVDPHDIEWVEGQLTPHPYRTFTEPSRLAGAVSNVPCTQIATAPGVGVPFVEWAARSGWPCCSIQTGHDAMVTEPQMLASLLLDLAAT